MTSAAYMPAEEGATRRLSAFCTELSFDAIPIRIVDRLKLYIIDALACALIGAEQRPTQIVAEYARELGRSRRSHLIGSCEPASVGLAALVNGVAIGAFESEHIGHNAHPSGTCLPAALAVAEAERAMGRDFLVALAVGYEVTCRIGAAQTLATEFERGFHNPAVNGPFGAAAATSRLLGLDVEQVASALGLAGSYAGGLTEYAWSGSMVKRLHLGRAARAGVEAATLAARGLTGPATILEGRSGYLRAFSPRPEPAMLTAGLGETWLLEDLEVKPYPCHGTCQATVAAITEAAIEVGELRDLELVLAGRMADERHWITEPNDLASAQFSVPFMAAVAFHRDLRNPRALDESVLRDFSIRRLAMRVQRRFAADPAPGWGRAELNVTLRTGQVRLEAGAFRGSRTDPGGVDDVIDKLFRYAPSTLHKDSLASAVSRVLQLERETRMGALLNDLCRT